MKKIIALLFLLLCTKTVLAQSLCDASCNLTITFPDGGSITALEPLTITFGDGGLVDTVATTTAYVNGNTLMLAMGDVVAFGAGGSFDLGASGNVDYTNIAIATTGDIAIEAIEGAGTITFDNVSFTAGTLNVNSDVMVDGNLTLTGGVTLVSAGSITVTGTLNWSGDGTISSTGAFSNTGTISISSGTLTLGSGLITSSGTITAVSGSLDIQGAGSLTLADGQIVTNATLGAIELNNANAVINAGSLNITPEPSTNTDGSGAINLSFVYGLFAIVLGFRRRHVIGFPIR